MGRSARYIAVTAAIYTVVVGLAWAWVLGVDFDWWKLPLIGALNGTLTLIGLGIVNSKGEKETRS